MSSWSKLINDAQNSKGIQLHEELPSTKFLSADAGSSYIRIIPFRNEFGELELKREYSYHRIPTPDKDGNYKTKKDGTLTKLSIPCKGNDCVYCKQVKRLSPKDAYSRESFMYGTQTDFFVLGIVLTLKSGKLVPNGEGIVPIQLSGGYKQAGAFLNFLTNGISADNLGLKNPVLAGLNHEEISEKVFGFETGYPLEFETKVTKTKDGKNKRVCEVSLISTQTFPLEESKYNLNKLHNYAQTVQDRASASLTQVIDGILGVHADLDNKVEDEKDPWGSDDLKNDMDSIEDNYLD